LPPLKNSSRGKYFSRGSSFISYTTFCHFFTDFRLKNQSPTRQPQVEDDMLLLLKKRTVLFVHLNQRRMGKDVFLSFNSNERTRLITCPLIDLKERQV
jgi:hypothetical protein